MSDKDHFDSLPDGERARIVMQVDFFVMLLLRRYGIKDDEVPELLAAVRKSVEEQSRMKQVRGAGAIALITTIVGGLLLALWEGIKVLIRVKGG